MMIFHTLVEDNSKNGLDFVAEFDKAINVVNLVLVSSINCDHHMRAVKYIPNMYIL